MKKKKLSPLTIASKKLGTNASGRGFITPRHENSVLLYFNEINGSDCAPTLTKSDEKILYEKYIKTGCIKSRDRLIKSNLRFVVSVAKHYQNQGLPFEDLVNEGNYGLIKALDKFDPTLNIKFFSYAVWWIRQSILQSLVENGKMIRIPINKKDSLILVNRRINELEQKLQRKPTIDEIVEVMDDMDAKGVSNVLRSNLTQISLDAPLGGNSDDDDSSLYDTLPSEDYNKSSKPEEVLKEINDILSNLKDDERSIVEMYFGVLCDRKYTLEEIGEKFDLTRERIRQIKEKAVRKLRNNPKIQELLEYVIES